MNLPISKDSFTPPPDYQLDYWFTEYEKHKQAQLELFIEAARWGYLKACDDMQKSLEQP